MYRSIFLSVLLGFIASGAASTALADPISITGTSTTLTPSADKLLLNANATNFTLGNPFTLQTGTYAVGNSGNLNGTFPISFSENVTLGGQTQAVVFTGQNLVTNPTMANTDFLTIFGQSIYFSSANETLNIQQFVSPAFTSGVSTPVTLTATVTGNAVAVTPEPSSLLLLSTGLLAIAGIATKRSISGVI